MTEPTKTAPLIGQFSGPKDNAPREALQRKEDADAVDAAEQEIKAIQEKLLVKPPTKEEMEARYNEGLERVGLSRAQARTIIDSMLQNNSYEEKFLIGGRLPVIMRTRSYYDIQRASRYLELERPTFASNAQDLLARYNLAASLKAYGERVFDFPQRLAGSTDEKVESAFSTRLNFVMELQTPVLLRLMEIMTQFDNKVAAALADGAPTDF